MSIETRLADGVPRCSIIGCPGTATHTVAYDLLDQDENGRRTRERVSDAMCRSDAEGFARRPALKATVRPGINLGPAEQPEPTKGTTMHLKLSDGTKAHVGDTVSHKGVTLVGIEAGTQIRLRLTDGTERVYLAHELGVEVAGSLVDRPVGIDEPPHIEPDSNVVQRHRFDESGGPRWVTVDETMADLAKANVRRREVRRERDGSFHVVNEFIPQFSPERKA